MGYNPRNDEIRHNIRRVLNGSEAEADALAVVDQFNARLTARKVAWFREPADQAVAQLQDANIDALEPYREPPDDTPSNPD
jgi:hypothetical protein